MNKVAFFLTYDQIDALKTLEAFRAAWPTFGRGTWLALVKKGLVTLDPKPMLTHAGRAYLSFNRALEAVNRPSGAEAGHEPRTREPARCARD